MSIAAARARMFAQLHVPGDPLILFNAWDAGSAAAIAGAGARAIATGSWSVATAHGALDGEALALDLAIANAARIAQAVELPVSIDFEGGYAVSPELLGGTIARLAATGAAGCNLEDQRVGGEGLFPTAEQVARIAAARHAAGRDFFLNARTDIFLKTPRKAHDEAAVAAAIDRAQAYEVAGASGFFAAGLADLALIERLCAAVALPVNILKLDDGPSVAQLAAAGVARVSYGGYPYQAAMQALGDAARDAFSWH